MVSQNTFNHNGFDFKLNFESRILSNLIFNGISVYIGGNAGSGKTTLLRYLATCLHKKFHLQVAVTASTGIAALHLQGKTFHRLLGVPICNKNQRNISNVKMRRSRALKFIDVLIIDEVSLLSSWHLDLLHRTACNVRHEFNKPFGGIQVILSGDFLQLTIPEVTERYKLKSVNSTKIASAKASSLPKFTLKGSQVHSNSNLSKHKEQSALSLEKEILRDTNPIFLSVIFQKYLWHVGLRHAHRHSSDILFRRSLNALRYGKWPQSIARLALENKEEPNAIHLYPTRRAATEYNMQQLAKFHKYVYTFKSRCLATIAIPTKKSDLPISDSNSQVNLSTKTPGQYYSGCWIPFSRMRSMSQSIHMDPMMEALLETKYLAVGARVMLWMNLTDCLVNGSCGTISRLIRPSQTDFEKLKVNGVMLPTQRLCYRSLASPQPVQQYLHITNSPTKMCSADLSPGISPVSEWQDFSESYIIDRWIPVVRFDRDPDVEVAIPWIRIPIDPVFIDSLRWNKLALARRLVSPFINYFSKFRDDPLKSQLIRYYAMTMPLSLAYAFTVHKIQGITFDQPVLFDGTTNFPCPHLVYVAASRVRTKRHLRMIHVHSTDIIVDPVACKFTRSLPQASQLNKKWKHLCKKFPAKKMVVQASWIKYPDI